MRALLLAVALAAGCAHAPLAPAGALDAGGLARLYCIDHPACTIYRSAQPSAAEFSVLVARYGIRSVVKLNSALEGRDQVPGGVELLEHPWLPAGPVDHEDIAAALWDLEQAPKPALVHCERGLDRTGLLVALYRVKHGSAAAAAYGEWRAFGRDMNLVLLTRAFERETGWKAP
ncbi:MAG: tyrosine-protein phosphatase [Steroidobacteraceae bacterium]